MKSGPIDKRLRECTDGDSPSALRAGKLLRALPTPAPLTESARQRGLWALGASSRSGRRGPFTTLQWAVFAVLIVFSAVASAKRTWWRALPSWLEWRAPVVENTAESTARNDSPSTNAPSKPTPPELREPPVQKAAGTAPSARSRASSQAKSEPVRPRLLSNPQHDSIPRVLPRLVYDVDTYSILLDVCVSAQGKVEKVSVSRGQEPTLDQEIIEAVQRWTYEPAQADGHPVAMCFPLVYRIQVQRD